MDETNRLSVDAVPQIPVTESENDTDDVKIEILLNDFRSEDYKSAFFLLLDYVKPQNFFALTKRDTSSLRDYFIRLYHYKLNDKLLVELLGTLKMYKKLRMLKTCFHVFESKEKHFNGIHGFWKVLYSLCEELTEDELQILKQRVPPDFQSQIVAAEDWFCWGLNNELFSKSDLSNLHKIFIEYPRCVDILKSYKDYGFYDIRTPTCDSNCGIAVIFNYQEFEEGSDLTHRDNSQKDVESLRRLWDMFGFEVYVHHNLTCSQTFEKMKEYASLNHCDYDAFVCCILSHGESNVVYSCDGEAMAIPELQADIMNCATLNQKPKLFFIQACQGYYVHGGSGGSVYPLKAETPGGRKPYSSSPPVLSDTLLVTSTINGYVSFRDNCGSWFVQALCSRLMSEGEDCPLEELLALVTEDVRNKWAELKWAEGGPKLAANQIPNRISTLGKKLLLKKRTH